MREILASGALGATLTLPDAWHTVEERPGYGLYLDEWALKWQVSFAPGLLLDLSPAHRDHHRAHAERIARDMFIKATHALSSHASPRTDDPSWSPMITFEHETICGAQALRMVHRMLYEPGHEYLMGHLLLPLERGLLELRCMVYEQGMTGLRETALLLKRSPEPGTFLPQAEYDAPEHDAAFPDHPLSRTRQGLDAITRCITSVSRPESDLPVTSCTDKTRGYTLVPPPRFAPDDEGRLVRCSFCATDGLSFLEHDIEPSRVRTEELKNVAVLKTHELLEQSGGRDLLVRAADHEPGVVSVFIRGEDEEGPFCHAFVYRLENDQLFHVAILHDNLTPLEELGAELLTCVRGATFHKKKKRFFGLF